MSETSSEYRSVYAQSVAELLDGLCALPHQTLSQLNDEAIPARSRFRSGLVERVERAWVTPLREITCDQVRVLVSQKIGLKWLAEPVAIFVAQFPRVECDVFPGDMTLNALSAATEFLRYAPAATLAMLAADYTWLATDFADDDFALWKTAEAELRAARKPARIS